MSDPTPSWRLKGMHDDFDTATTLRSHLYVALRANVDSPGVWVPLGALLSQWSTDSRSELLAWATWGEGQRLFDALDHLQKRGYLQYEDDGETTLVAWTHRSPPPWEEGCACRVDAQGHLLGAACALCALDDAALTVRLGGNS